MRKIELMAEKMERLKEKHALSTPETRQRAALDKALQEQKEKIKKYWKRQGLNI